MYYILKENTLNWGKELRNYIVDNRLSIWVVARKLRVTEQTVYKWINYESTPTRTNQNKIRQMLQMGNHGKINKISIID